MAGPVSYASTSDLAVYVPNADSAAEAAIWTTFLDLASRAIDWVTDRYFWTEATPATRYFDGDGTRFLDLNRHDFFGPVTVKVALYENADPASSVGWMTLVGDGVVPPSNFFCEPGNPNYIAGSATLREPFYRLVIPEFPIQANFNGILIWTPGRRTVQISPAGWGWPAIPSDIKDTTIQVVIRMWKAREEFFQSNSGAAEPVVSASAVVDRYFTPHDLAILSRYRRPQL